MSVFSSWKHPTIWILVEDGVGNDGGRTVAYPQSEDWCRRPLGHVTGSTKLHRRPAPHPCGLACAAHHDPIKRAVYALCHSTLPRALGLRMLFSAADACCILIALSTFYSIGRLCDEPARLRQGSFMQRPIAGQKDLFRAQAKETSPQPRANHHG